VARHLPFVARRCSAISRHGQLERWTLRQRCGAPQRHDGTAACAAAAQAASPAQH
jgi:hypothetical protein